MFSISKRRCGVETPHRNNITMLRLPTHAVERPFTARQWHNIDSVFVDGDQIDCLTLRQLSLP
jgi:hypothetical protein